MSINLESIIQSIITRASAGMAQEIATAVRESLRQQIFGSGGTHRAATTSTVAAPVKRGPGRPRKTPVLLPSTSSPTHAPQAAPAEKIRGRRKAARGARRSSEQVAQDDARILEHIKAHPGVRSVEMREAIGLAKQNLASGLDRLRQAGLIKAKGVRSATTYTAG